MPFESVEQATVLFLNRPSFYSFSSRSPALCIVRDTQMRKMSSGQRKRTAFTPDPRIDATKYVIPFIHENNNWSKGATYRVRVSNVYDPSKFWIVGMGNGLATFQTSMANFYLKNGKQYKFKRSLVKKDTYCVACVSDAYFRAIIVNKPFGIERKVPVFLIDFGFHDNVKLSGLYHFHKSYYDIPRFGVRARLSNIKPYEGYSWTNHCVKQFEALVRDKILAVTMGHVDPVEKVVYISPQIDPSAEGSFADITKALIDMKLAKEEDGNVSRVAVCRVPHFLPIFGIIESGGTPNLLKMSAIMKRNPSTLAMVKIYLKKGEKIDL